MGNFCFLVNAMSVEASQVRFDGTVLSGSLSMLNNVKYEHLDGEFVSHIVRIAKENVLLVEANVGDEVSIWIERKFGMQLPVRMSGKLLLGTDYNASDIGNNIIVSVDEGDVCALEKARAMFYVGKMKSEGVVVKLFAENKTIQVELLGLMYAPLNTKCTFNYNSHEYNGKVVKIIK